MCHRVLNVSLRILCLFCLCTAGHWLARPRDPAYEKEYSLRNKSNFPESETKKEWSKSLFFNTCFRLVRVIELRKNYCKTPCTCTCHHNGSSWGCIFASPCWTCWLSRSKINDNSHLLYIRIVSKQQCSNQRLISNRWLQPWNSNILSHVIFSLAPKYCAHISRWFPEYIMVCSDNRW